MRKILCGLAAVAVLSFAVAQPVEAKVFKWSYKGDVNSMDPYALRESFTQRFLLNIYEGLVRYNETLEHEPALATGWEILDATTWRFTLRKGVKFHNGNTFNADDVVFSYRRGSHENSPFRGNLHAVKDVVKVDDFTVDIKLNTAYPLLLNDLTAWYMMDKEWAEAIGAAAPVNPGKGEDGHASANANGTGPFMLKSRQPDSKTVLINNPNWWDTPKHNLTEVIFTPISSDATRVAALLSGELDMMRPVPLQDIERVKRSPGLRVLQQPAMRVVFLAMDMASDELKESNVKGKNPLKDIRVRRALYQAINIEAIKKSVMLGRSRPTGLLLAQETKGYDAAIDTRLPFDPEAAKKLMAEAGYADGFEVGFDCPNDRYINDERICQAIVPMWARIGVKAKLLAQTKGRHFKKMLEPGNSSIFMFGWASLPVMDVMSLFTSVIASQDGKLGAWNPGGYSNKRVDELIGLIGQEYDQEKRQAYISEALKIHKSEIGHIPLHQQTLAWGVRDGVNVIQTGDEYLRLWYTTIDK